MPNVALYDIKGQNIGDIALSETVFGQPVNAAVMHEVVVAHLANCRQGTQSAKTRAEVSGGGKKPWRQKGTGRARQGSTRSPQWRHGGIVFDALNIEAPKTKEMVKVLKAVDAGKALIVLADKDDAVERASANIEGVKTTLVGTLSVYEILKYEKLILTKASAEKIEEVYA